MKRIYYPAMFEKTDDGYSVFFPDLPGCVSAGVSLEKAFIEAHDALSLHTDGMREDGEALPSPSSIDKLEKDDSIDTVMLVGVNVPEKTKRINITLDEAIIESIDKVTGNRSRFLADAAVDALGKVNAG
ncbi:MAG: type II toxin-antitoxin system HicB family antitoxin [Hyphomicrobiaceae bacterium]|nr:type II toxin-antitoxin system HicB family antitoxin [Hyphomicrobiaceae bacterium]